MAKVVTDELKGLRLNKFSDFAELYPARAPKPPKDVPKAGSNPFGAAASEFNVTPLGSGLGGMPGVIDNPLARIQTGLPEYDNMMSSMYPQPPAPTPPAPPTAPPAPTPLRSRSISDFSPAAQAYLAKAWGKIGAGAAMPGTLGAFLMANLAFRQPRPKSAPHPRRPDPKPPRPSDPPRQPRPPKTSPMHNPFAGIK